MKKLIASLLIFVQLLHGPILSIKAFGSDGLQKLETEIEIMDRSCAAIIDPNACIIACESIKEPMDTFPVQEAHLVFILEDKEPVYSPATSKLYSEEDIIAIAKTLYGECRGTKYKTIQSGVAWCILNRYDAKDHHYGKTITAVCSRKEDFQGYNKSNPVRKDLYNLAKDVLERWAREKNGELDVGRTLPKEYLYFRDFYDGNKNIFFTTWNNAPTLKKLKQQTAIWRWTDGNPYGEKFTVRY